MVFSLTVLSVPAKRYALTLQLMLKRSRDKRKSLSPSSMREARPLIDPALMPPSSQPSEGSSPTFGNRPQQTDAQMQAAVQQGYHHYPMDAEHIWDRYQRTASEQLPVWISDQTLGGQRFSQEGMNAYLLPNEYMPPAPQIW